MAHSQLSRQGVFTKDPLRAKLSYSVMLLVRCNMPGVFSVKLAQALTIATRYSVVRHQGLGPADTYSIEASILQYKHQHFRLLSMIAKSYAMFFASRACEVQYNKLREMQSRKDHSLLPSVHALTAGLKAYVTSEAVDDAEDARKLCGGHGYMIISGLPDIIGALAGGATFEGENYVLWQQVGRHLLKQFDRLQGGDSLEPQMQYLTDLKDVNVACTAEGEQFLEPRVQLAIYRGRAHRLVSKVHAAIRATRKTPGEAWNEHMMLLISASRVTPNTSFSNPSTILLPLYRRARLKSSVWCWNACAASSLFLQSSIRAPLTHSLLSRRLVPSRPICHQRNSTPSVRSLTISWMNFCLISSR